MTRLEQLRLDRVQTPEQLGADAKVSGKTIRRLEAGGGAQVATLGRLAKVLGVPVSELLRDVAELERAA